MLKKLEKTARKLGFRFHLGLTLISAFSLAVLIYTSTLSGLSLGGKVLGVTSSGSIKYINRFSTTDQGGLTFIGNSVGLTDSKITENETAGNFITPAASATDSISNSAAITSDWSKNGSFSNLVLPKNATILYAELVWGGSYKYDNVSLENKIDTPVTLLNPSSSESKISPDPATSALLPDTSGYVRSSNVTDLVKKGGAGKYTVKGIPAMLDGNNPYNNYGGWTLAVAYQDKSTFPKNMTIFVGSQQVGPDQSTSTAEVSGFSTPANGGVSGRLLVSAQEGDSMFGGDQMLFGSDPAALSPVSGPNNKADNFFAAQINSDDGKIDTSGSFGNSNLTVGTNSGNERQGWDVTNVPVNQFLKNSQTKAYAKGTSRGDVYIINALGLQIDANAPSPIIELSADRTKTFVGDVVTYTTYISNNGTADMDNSVFSALVPEGTSFVSDSLKVDGNIVSSSGASGKVGKISPGQSVEVTYQVKVNSIPASQKYVDKATVNYDYTMISGGEILQGTLDSNEVVIVASESKLNPPVANDDSATTDKNKAVTIAVLSNDTDADGDIKADTLEITANPRNGTVVINGLNAIYTPNNNYFGNDTFQYKICDSTGFCDTAIVSVTINEIKPIYPPIANDVNIKTKQDVPVQVDVLTSVSDQDNNIDNSTLAVSKQPTNGKTQVIDGKITYTPNPGYSGSDTFEYKICDKDKQCDTALVNITIDKPVIISPTPVNDEVTTDYQKPVTIPVLNNDLDNGKPLLASTLKITTNPTKGTVTINDKAEVIYTPKAGQAGSDTFEYQICNTDGNCGKAAVKVNIGSPLPDAIDDTANVDASKNVTIEVITNDKFPDSDVDNLTFEITKLPTSGTAVVNGDNIVFTPNVDASGTDTLTYKICNKLGGCDTASVAITINRATTDPLPNLKDVGGSIPVSTTSNSSTTSSLSSSSGFNLGTVTNNTFKTAGAAADTVQNTVRSGGAITYFGIVAFGAAMGVGLVGVFWTLRKDKSEQDSMDYYED
ncbi:MAG: Ig-like domain-containing protein [bacterium]